MPYTTPLDDPPSFPNAQTRIVGPDGKPTTEFATWLNSLRDWIERAQAALEEVEP